MATVNFDVQFAENAYTVQFEETSMELDAQFEPNGGGGGGGAVNSVNGKTGTVVLDAGDLEYDDSETYSEGSVGAELTSLNGDYTELDGRVTALEQGGSGGGLTADIKAALLQLAAKVAYVDDDGQDYYDDLYDAFYPPAGLVSITAVYTQSGTVYTSDSLDSLKTDLVVTAHYDDQSTETVTNYTLSGTLTAGTSTITVSYGGKTTTFTVTVTAAKTLSSISAVYTQSGTVYTTDSLDSLKTDLVVTAHWSDSTTSTVASADYTLSGSLTEGTSTITVTYGGKTTTFTVTVTAAQRIPSGYVEVEYAERPSTATAAQYVNTGVKLSGTGTAVFDVTFMSKNTATDNRYVVDIKENASGSSAVGFGVAINRGDSIVYSFSGGSTANLTVDGGLDNKKLTVQATVNSTGWTISDGVNTNSVTESPRDYSNQAVCLYGAKKNTDQVANAWIGYIYYVKVTENNVVKLELIPCKRSSDDAVGFWDTVNEAFYTNSVLVAGPEVTS